MAVVATCVLILGMWIVVYVWGRGPAAAWTSWPPRPSPGRPSPICKVTADRLAALPKAFQSPNNVARAEVVAQTNADLRAMLAQLATIVPSGNDGRIVREWLSDYRTYVGNREDYARRLRTDPTARFYESQKNPGEQISDPDRHPGHGQPHGRLRGPRRPVLTAKSRVRLADGATPLALSAMSAQIRTIEPTEVARLGRRHAHRLPVAAGARRRSRPSSGPPPSTSTTSGPPSTAARIVGTLRSFDTTVAVPGDATVSAAALTHVTVSATPSPPGPAVAR